MTSPPPPRHPPWLRIVAVLSICLLGGGAVLAQTWGWQFLSRPTPQIDASAVPTRLLTVHALGRLEPRGRLIRLAPPSGNEGARVEELLFDEGDDVPADTVVARLDTFPRRQAEFAEAEARRDTALARLEQTKAGAKSGEIEAQAAAVALLERQIQVTQRELARAEKLVQQKVLSTEDFDTKQWAHDRIVLEHRRAVHTLEGLQEVRVTDVRVQEREVATAEAAVAVARSLLEASLVRTRLPGRILKVHTRPGEKIKDEGLAELGDVTRMQAVAEVYEADVALLEPGLRAEVKLDSTNEILYGEVAEIGLLVARKIVLTNDPVSDTDARVVEVRITLTPRDSQRVARLSNARVELTISLPDPAAKKPQNSEPLSDRTVNHALLAPNSHLESDRISSAPARTGPSAQLPQDRHP